MPSSPAEADQNEPETRRNRVEDSSRKKDYHDYNRDRDRNRDRNQGFGNDRKEHSDRREHRERKRKRRWDTPDKSPLRSQKFPELQPKESREHDADDKTFSNKILSKQNAKTTVTSLDEQKDMKEAVNPKVQDSISRYDILSHFS